MQSEKPSLNSRADDDQAYTSRYRPSAADDSIPPLAGDDGSTYPSPIGQSPANTSDQALALIAQSTDEEDVDMEAWTQIPGPSDDEMSDSDESEADASVQYQTPRAVQQAEHSRTRQPPGLRTTPYIHQRYKDFTSLLCKETATEVADRHVLDGLPLAIDTAKSIWLDQDTVDDDELDMYAFALVVHVWQLVCMRMQHGRFPSTETDNPLCTTWAAYFLAAHTLVDQNCPLSLEEFKHIVQYWEDRLRLTGGGDRWMGDRWGQNIPSIYQDVAVHRNDIADRYLKALEEFGKEGLMIAIIEEEKKGESTQLRQMIQRSVDGMKFARRQIISMLYSMDTSLLKVLIQGQLPRLAEIESGPVYEALRVLNEQKFIQPGIYMNCICDYAGFSPTPEQWRKVCEQMLKYVQYGDEYNDLAEQIDQKIHPKSEWPKELAHRAIRRYTEWRSFTGRGSYDPDSVHRRWVKYFVDQLQKRMDGEPVHAPLNVPVVEFGFSNDPDKRLRQHRHHESSNYLMNLAEAVFDVEYPGYFRLQQRIVFACYRSVQTWLGEIIITQLAQGYVEGGGGFSHETAGRSNTSSNKTVPTKVWTMFEGRVYADGGFEKEVEANSQRLQQKKEAMEQARARLEEEREAQRHLLVERITTLEDAVAAEESQLNLLEALRDRLSKP